MDSFVSLVVVLDVYTQMGNGPWKMTMGSGWGRVFSLRKVALFKIPTIQAGVSNKCKMVVCMWSNDNIVSLSSLFSLSLLCFSSKRL